MKFLKKKGSNSDFADFSMPSMPSLQGGPEEAPLPTFPDDEASEELKLPDIPEFGSNASPSAAPARSFPPASPASPASMSQPFDFEIAGPENARKSTQDSPTRPLFNRRGSPANEKDDFLIPPVPAPQPPLAEPLTQEAPFAAAESFEPIVALPQEEEREPYRHTPAQGGIQSAPDIKSIFKPQRGGEIRSENESWQQPFSSASQPALFSTNKFREGPREVFIKGENYREVMEGLDSILTAHKEANTSAKPERSLLDMEEKEHEKLITTIEELQRSLILTEKTLFE